MIPNPVAWLLPEFVAFGNDIQAIVRVPSPGSGAPLGARISPTSDGFLIWLPSGMLSMPLLFLAHVLNSENNFVKRAAAPGAVRGEEKG